MWIQSTINFWSVHVSVDLIFGLLCETPFHELKINIYRWFEKRTENDIENETNMQIVFLEYLTVYYEW